MKILDAALSYAELGWHVLPLKERGKAPITKHGFKDATTDMDVIMDWWDRWPNSNVGIATGASGLVVMDVDWGKKKQGKVSFARMGLEYPNHVWDTWKVFTGEGAHFYFLKNVEPTKSTNNVLPGIDVRAEGGYVVAPPSVHPTGRVYEWKEPRPGRAPRYLSSELNLKLRKSAPVHDAPGVNGKKRGYSPLERVPEGQRNDEKMRLTGYLIQTGFSAEWIEKVLHGWNLGCCEPPLSDKEIHDAVMFAKSKHVERGHLSSNGYTKVYGLPDTGSRPGDAIVLIKMDNEDTYKVKKKGGSK